MALTPDNKPELRKPGNNGRPVPLDGQPTLGQLQKMEGAPDILQIYLEEIRRYPVLTHAEEIMLAQKIESGRKARQALSDPDSLLSLQLRGRYSAEIDQADNAARELTNHNLRLVFSCAGRHTGKGVDLTDLIQEGNVGLTRAVDKYDWRRGYKFSTCATWWIRQAITRAIADQARTIRIPVHMVETINRFNRTQRRLMQELGREPTPGEVAEVLGIDESKAWEIIKVSQELTSLETPVGDEEDSRLGDFIADPNAQDPADQAVSDETREMVRKFLEKLAPRDRMILQLRFGIDGGRERTLEEVGNEFGVTRARVKQIEDEAKEKLKKLIKAGDVSRTDE